MFPDSESPNQGSSGLTRSELFIYSKILSLNSDGVWTLLSNKLNVEYRYASIIDKINIVLKFNIYLYLIVDFIGGKPEGSRHI